MRARAPGDESGNTPETARWLEAIRRRLAPNMPMATRLVVRAPQYADFSIVATIEVSAGRDPSNVKTAVERELKSRLALTGVGARHAGVSVTRRDVTAWIRVVDGVRRIVALRLLNESGIGVDEIKVTRVGLPRCDFTASTLDVRRADTRSAP
jgi:phage-related baseplate assembly protein